MKLSPPRPAGRRSLSLLAAFGSLYLAISGPRHAVGQPARGVSEAEAKAVLQTWLQAQNARDFARYATLYAADFQGVRRSGERTVRLNREAWLRDRERMFKAPMSVDADYTQVVTAQDSASVTFVQRWSAGRFADVGQKRMSLRRLGGNLVIASEELLCSLMIRQKGRRVLYASATDAKAAHLAYPELEVQALPLAGPQTCQLDQLAVWTFKTRQRASGESEGQSYEVVVWDEQHNPKAETNYDINFGGGVLVSRDGSRIWSRDDSGCEAAPMLHVPRGLVLPLTCSTAYHGEESSTLNVFRIEGERVREVASVPVVANDTSGSDSYSYRAKVEYRDTNGDGVTDIVVTPTERRNVGGEYPKAAKVIQF